MLHTERDRHGRQDSGRATEIPKHSFKNCRRERIYHRLQTTPPLGSLNNYNSLKNIYNLLK